MSKKKPSKQELSTVDRLISKKNFREKLEKAEVEFALSEVLIEIMEVNKISVRKLAKKTGLAPSVIQNIRSGTSSPTFETLSAITNVLGYNINLTKGRKKISFCHN